MREVLATAIHALGLTGQVRTLEKNHAYTTGCLADSERFLRDRFTPTDVPLDLVLFGSLARGEASERSDLDYLVVVHNLPQDVTLSRSFISAAEELRLKLGLEKPGATRTFGRLAFAPALTETIGLEEDTTDPLRTGSY